MALTDWDYTRNWAAVIRETEALYGARRWSAYTRVIRKAIAATNNPDGKSVEELEAVVEYHGGLINGSCECPVCVEHARRTGAL